MALRNIRKEEDAILRKISKPIDKITDKIKILVEDMIETMNSANGVGLAAPQVGILKRIYIVDVGDGPIVFINPEIVEQSGEETCQEGCLSVPGKYGDVTRPAHVKVMATNLEGEQFFIEGEGLLARAMCHELDHLNGVLFIDKATNIEEL